MVVVRGLLGLLPGGGAACKYGAGPCTSGASRVRPRGEELEEVGPPAAAAAAAAAAEKGPAAGEVIADGRRGLTPILAGGATAAEAAAGPTVAAAGTEPSAGASAISPLRTACAMPCAAGLVKMWLVSSREKAAAGSAQK